jgi:peptidoglycan/LPS O-acetylase OafA/YrhL
MKLSQLIAYPGMFRLMLAYLVFINHTYPLHVGSVSVYLFFMLSGYWVYTMWFKEYATTDRPYWNFIFGRFWRVYPIYYTAIGLSFVVNHFLHGHDFDYQPTGPLVALHYYLSHIFIYGYSPLPRAAQIMPPVWSLDIEMQFYLVAPLLILVWTRSGAWSMPRLLIYAIGIIGLAIYVTLVCLKIEQSGYLPMYLLFFLVGVQTAHGGWRPRPALAVGGCALALGLMLLSIAIPTTRSLLVEGKYAGWLTPYFQLAHIGFAVLMAPYAMATVRKIPAKTSIFRWLDRDFGNLTYEVYLFHESLLLVAWHYVSGLPRLQQVPGLLLVAVGILPIDRRRKAYLKSQQRLAGAPPAAETGALANQA